MLIIAEIGINHNGDVDIAKKLIDMTIACGCDAVKFQKRAIDVVYSQEFLNSPRDSPWGTTQRDQKEGLEFGGQEYDEIDQYCQDRAIKWFASAWDIDSLEFLDHFDLPYNKIASPMITHIKFVRTVAMRGKHTFISTGMSTCEDVNEIVAGFEAHHCPYTLMHCVSVYPCKDSDCNIRCLAQLKARYDCPIGYSGHEVGLLPSILAVAMGAEVIERHITLDRSSYGSDQAASLEKRGLELLVKECRAVEKTLGDGKKRILADEAANARKLRYWK